MDRLADGGTITGELGETKKKVFWAHDKEWESEKLTFDLIDAPSFVTIDDTAKLNVYGVYQVKIKVGSLMMVAERSRVITVNKPTLKGN